MAVFRVEKNKDYTSMANYHFKDKTLSWKAKGILSTMLSLPEDWDYSLAGLTVLASDGMSATRNAIKELEEHGYLIRRPLRKDNKIYDWEYLIFESPKQKLLAEKLLVENQQIGNQQVENLYVENRTQLNTKELNTKELNTNNKKESKKESTYEKILSEVQDDSLRDLYIEYIKMRKLIKSPMTDRALTMLINKVNTLEPTDINRKKQLLETAIIKNWKSVYPIREENNDKQKQAAKDWNRIRTPEEYTAGLVEGEDYF